MKTSIVRMAIGAMSVACMTCHGQVVPKHRDLLVGISNGNFGSIYVIDSESGAIRGLFSGLGPSSTWPPPSRGSGPGLGKTFVHIVTTRAGRILATASSASQPIVELDPLTGNRSALAVSVGGNNFGASVLTQVDQREVLLGCSSPASSAAPQPDLLRVDLPTGTWGRVFGGLVGDGPVVSNMNAVALSNREHAYLSEYSIGGDSALYRVDLQSGRREILSLLGRTPAVRNVVSGGVYQLAATSFGPAGFGIGPAGNSTAYPVAIFDGRILSSVLSETTQIPYSGGVVEIDGATGDRTLMFGQALENGQLVAAPPVSGFPSGIQSVSAMTRSASGELLIATGFFPSYLIAWNSASNTARVLTDFSAQFNSSTLLLNFRVRSISVFTNCPADVNLDGIADDADFSPFAAAYSIGNCEDPSMPLPCPSDLNADGMVDDADFAIFMTGYDRLLCE